VPANGRRGRPQGKCHRKQTARASAAWQPAGKGETARQERTAPLATGAAGQTPPGARPNRGGGAARHRSVPPPPPGLVARGVPRGTFKMNGRPASRGDLGCGQNPAYRPSGTRPQFPPQGTKLESFQRFDLGTAKLSRLDSTTAPKLLRTAQKFCATSHNIRQIPLTTQIFPCYPVTSQGA
jgi:hypothetical protein